MNPHQLPVVAMPIGEESVQTVDARRLHEFLEVGRVFGAWLPDRIKSYGFTEGLDYVVFSETGKNSKVGRPTKEYAVSLGMAKELAMVERNAKGREARRYFIACEKAANERVIATQGLTADDVKLLVADALKAASSVELVKASEYETSTVLNNGVTVAELVDNLFLPPGVSRRSVAQQLKHRLLVFSALQTLPKIKGRHCWQFARRHSGELAHAWRAEMIDRAKRDRRQTELRLVPVLVPVPVQGAVS